MSLSTGAPFRIVRPPLPTPPPLLWFFVCPPPPPKTPIFRRPGKARVNLSRLPLCRPAHRPSAAWRRSRARLFRDAKTLTGVLPRTQWHLFSGSSVSQNLGCERTSPSQRSRMAVGLGFFAFNHLALIFFEV